MGLECQENNRLGTMKARSTTSSTLHYSQSASTGIFQHLRNLDHLDSSSFLALDSAIAALHHNLALDTRMKMVIIQDSDFIDACYVFSNTFL